MLNFNFVLIAIGAFLFIIVLLSVFYLYLLDFISKISSKLRDFIAKNESFFEILFLSLFTIEQIVLLYLIYKFGINLPLFQLGVGIFVLTVVGTASLQKIILNIKNKQLKDVIFEQDIEYEKVTNEHKLFEKITESKFNK